VRENNGFIFLNFYHFLLVKPLLLSHPWRLKREKQIKDLAIFYRFFLFLFTARHQSPNAPQITGHLFEVLAKVKNEEKEAKTSKKCPYLLVSDWWGERLRDEQARKRRNGPVRSTVHPLT